MAVSFLSGSSVNLAVRVRRDLRTPKETQPTKGKLDAYREYLRSHHTAMDGGNCWGNGTVPGNMKRMDTLLLLMPPAWLVRIAVAAVWIHEGLWCKILGREKHELRIVEAVPRYGERFGRPFLTALGWIEFLLGLWVLSGWAPGLCALGQTVLLVALNANGLIWSRQLIQNPVGMVLKNFAFLVLCWVNAGLAG